ncbi:MAG TPA: nicotinate-nucleotide adenylyltransferase [Solirubrobacteraceae bacterium]
MRAGRSACASYARSSTSSRATDTSAPEQPPPGEQPRSLGILGGSFNPPHVGHLAVARHARAELGLERVVLMPAHTQPVKGPGRDPGPEHRLRMCRLAAAGAAGVSVCALEIERGGASYTVDTLRSIHASHPHVDLTFIVGADTAATLPAWREPEALLELAGLGVAARGGSDRRRVLDALAGLGAGGGDGARVRFLEMSAIDVSSSRARERAARGEPIEQLVGPAVADYIAEHRLYRAGAPAPSAGGSR